MIKNTFLLLLIIVVDNKCIYCCFTVFYELLYWKMKIMEII